MPTFTLQSGRRVANNSYRLEARSYDGERERLVASFYNPVEFTSEELAELKELLSSNYYGMEISSVEIRVPNKSYVGVEWEQMSPKAMRKQIREWLRGGNIVRSESGRRGGNQVCVTCSQRGRDTRPNYSSALAPLSTTMVKCVVCVAEDIFDGVDNSVLRHGCSKCGDAIAVGHLPSITGEPQPACISCMTYYCDDRQCWNCSKGFKVTKDVTTSFYAMYGVGNNRAYAYEIHFCGDCNYVPKNACEVCGDNKATSTFKDTNGQSYSVCDECRENRICTCIRCEKTQWNSSRPMTMKLIESFYDSSNGTGKNLWACRQCVSYLPKCGKCNYTKTLDELQQFAGMCQTCAGNAITANVFYYRENVLDHITPKGKANRKLGVELELEWDGTDSRLQSIIQDIRMDTQEWGIVKRDGSLKAGIEFVTTPLTLDIHQEGIWEDFCSILGKSFKSEPTCGLHVHVSKAGSSNKGANKLLKLVYYNPSFWLNVAGRESKRYAPIRNIGLEQAVGDRYTALNFQNEPTFEFRMFGASTDADYIVARIELCDAAVRFSNSKLSDEDNMSIGSFYRYVRHNKRLYPLAVKLFKSQFALAKSVETDLQWRTWIFPTRAVGRPRRQRIGRSGRPAPPTWHHSPEPELEEDYSCSNAEQLNNSWGRFVVRAEEPSSIPQPNVGNSELYNRPPF